MSATTMNHSRRQILTPGPSNNKRKERDGGIDGFKSAVTTKSLAKPSIHRAPAAVSQQQVKSPQPTYNNQLLAGYLAHEFLSKGTLFGERFDPARAEAVPLSSSASARVKPIPEKRKSEPSDKTEKHQKYLEIADLLKADGAHLPGIVNPTQLARFLQLG